MRSEKTNNYYFLTPLILLPVAGGAGTYLAITKLTPDNADAVPFHTTRFYVQNESQNWIIP